MDSKGRVLLPKDIRRLLGLKEGSKLKVEVEGRKITFYPPVRAEEFIKEMQGYVKEVTPESPLKVKKI